MQTKIFSISIIAVAVIISGMILLSSNSDKNENLQYGNNNFQIDTSAPSVDNVSVVDGVQIITITAKGGYSPRTTNAKADIPTVIKMDTAGTFDCSSALAIPNLSYRSYLPPSGETLIDIPAQKSGTKLQGLCSMGMYNFAINFN
ncbi:MAG TPA: hypothetical protein PKA60_00720 [Candidatus Paceibacterota bacterium]|nr:hypothetical protein [Candidatus Paceibacterota bacterium]